MRLLKFLSDYFPKRPNPPFSNQDPFTLLVAVLLSAQCTDARVNKITPLLFAEADNSKGHVESPG